MVLALVLDSLETKKCVVIRSKLFHPDPRRRGRHLPQGLSLLHHQQLCRRPTVLLRHPTQEIPNRPKHGLFGACKEESLGNIVRDSRGDGRSAQGGGRGKVHHAAGAEDCGFGAGKVGAVAGFRSPRKL